MTISTVLIVAAMALLGVIAVLSYRTRRQLLKETRELIRIAQKNGSSLELLDERLRDGNLRILKCLKGESYAGSFGGFDVHTDSAIPSNTAIITNETR